MVSISLFENSHQDRLEGNHELHAIVTHTAGIFEVELPVVGQDSVYQMCFDEVGKD